MRLLILALFLGGCQTTPTVLTRSAKPIEIPKVLIEPCIDPAIIPPLPPNAMPPRGSDPRQLANGAAANSERLLGVIQAQREMLEACAKLSKEQK